MGIHNTMLCRDMVSVEPDDVTMIVLPLFHISGQVAQLTASIYAGCPTVLVPKFDPELVLVS